MVSVIIPAFNASAYIGEALDSVLAQTFDNYEAIVVNDGSPDTEALERKLTSYPAKVHYIKQENRGAAAARNTGLRAATGELVAFLDADDTWLPRFLETQVALLARNHADLVYADALLYGDSPLAGRTFMDAQPSRGEVTPEGLLAVDVTVLTSTVLARKRPILEAGLFDETLRRGHDFDLWLRLAKRGARFAYQREVVARHRIVETGLSGNTISQLNRTLSVLETVGARGDLSIKEQAALRFSTNRTLARLAVERGKELLLTKDFDGALNSFNKAWQLEGGLKLRLVCVGTQLAPDLLRVVHKWRVERQQTP